MSDAIDMQKFSTDNSLNVKEEEIRDILAKPIPPPPGISHDIGLLRRGLAAFVLGDLSLLRQIVVQAKKTMRNEEMLKTLLSSLVGLEFFHGNLQQALNDATYLETRMQIAAQMYGRPVVSSQGDVESISAYVEFAQMSGNLALAERVRKQYLVSALSNSNINPGVKLLAGLRNAMAEGRTKYFNGDMDGGYELVARGLSVYQNGYAQLKDKSALERLHAAREGYAYLLMGQIALPQGRYALTQQHLMSLRASLVNTNRLDKMDASTYHLLEAAYRSSVGDYERAIQAVDAWQMVARPAWREMPLFKSTRLVQRSIFLASLNRWDEAWRDIVQLSDKDLLGTGVIHDYGISARALIGSVSGRSDPKALSAFYALEPKYRQMRGTELSAAYFTAKTIVHHELARREQRDQNLALAVAAGREVSYAINAKLARGNGRQSTLGPALLRRAKESYLKAASAMVGRNGVTINDVMDALQLNQTNEVDMDVSSAAARLKSFQGVAPARLRELQDLQQKARGTQTLVSEYSRSVDAEEARLTAYVADANQAAARLDRLMTELKATAPQLAQAFGQGGKSITVSQLQQRLTPNEALITFVPTDDGTFALFVSKGGAEQKLLPATRQQIEALVQRVRRSVSFNAAVKLPPFDAEAARELHSALFGWLGPRMNAVKSLTVSASGSLGSIPFGLLIRENGGALSSSTYADFPWLIRSTAIAHAPSLMSWLVVTDPRANATTSGFLAWADPDFSGSRSQPEVTGVRGAIRLDKGNAQPDAVVEKTLSSALPNLPETADEARSIAKALGGSDADVLLAGSATRDSVLTRSGNGELSRKSVLMFATHGLVPADVPGLTQPALAMAQEAPGKGPSLLQLDDVVGLRLNADWVVLSACNTASADRVGGDPLSGLARGFFFAGARGMLVTHWEVETRSAAEITRRTFEHYVRDLRLSRAQALQRTAIDMIDSDSGLPDAWSHPAYWAPYALVGNGSRHATSR